MHLRPPPPCPAPLDRIRAELRALPAKNPTHPTDALLLLRDAVREGAIYNRIAGQHAVADALMEIADDAERLARVFAPADMAARDAELATIQTALRADGGA